MVSNIIRRMGLPVLVFVLGMGATLLACRRYEQSIRSEQLGRQRAQATVYLRNLELGLASITDFNEGLAAHVTTSQPLDRRNFDGYIAIREAFAPQPGLQSVAFLPRLAEEARKGHEVHKNRSPGARPAGKPDGSLVLAPVARAVSAGVGARSSIPSGEEAMRAAADAAVTIAAPYAGGGHMTMLALYTPVYGAATGRDQGQPAGFVRSTFELERTIRSALGRPINRELDLEIHDVAAGGMLVYDDDGVPRARQHEQLLTGFAVNFAGRHWNVQFFHRTVGPDAWPATRGLVLLSGLLLSYLLALATQLAVARIRRPYTHGAFAQNLHKAFEHHPFAVYYLDLGRRFVNVNESALAEFGLSRDELLGLGSEQLIAPELRDLGRTHWEAALRGTAASYDTVLQAPDGRRFDVNVVLVPMMSGGKVAGVLGIVENITERKRQADAVHRSRRTLQSIVDNLPQMVFWKGADRRVLGCNEKFAQFLGLDENQIIGCTDEDLCARRAQIDPSCIDQYREEDLRVLQSGEPVVGSEFLARRRDGHTFWARTSKLPMRDAEGCITGLLGVAEDITDRKLNELKLEQLANHDSLTGLPSRAFFLRQLDQALARTPPGMLAVAYFDIDRFKSINDSWGHDVGDHVIRIFARRARRLMRQSDVLGRLGGDEFVFFTEGLSRREVESACELLVATARRPIRVREGLALEISTSVGIAFHRRGMTADELLREADQAMYRAKASGRDGLHVAHG